MAWQMHMCQTNEAYKFGDRYVEGSFEFYVTVGNEKFLPINVKAGALTDLPVEFSFKDGNCVVTSIGSDRRFLYGDTKDMMINLMKEKKLVFPKNFRSTLSMVVGAHNQKLADVEEAERQAQVAVAAALKSQEMSNARTTSMQRTGNPWTKPASTPASASAPASAHAPASETDGFTLVVKKKPLSLIEKAQAAEIEAARVEAARVEAERIEAERIEAKRIEAKRIEAERIEAKRIEAERIEAERIEAAAAADAKAAAEEARANAEKLAEAERVEAAAEAKKAKKAANKAAKKAAKKAASAPAEKPSTYVEDSFHHVEQERSPTPTLSSIQEESNTVEVEEEEEDSDPVVEAPSPVEEVPTTVVEVSAPVVEEVPVPVEVEVPVPVEEVPVTVVEAHEASDNVVFQWFRHNPIPPALICSKYYSNPKSCICTGTCGLPHMDGPTRDENSRTRNQQGLPPLTYPVSNCIRAFLQRTYNCIDIDPEVLNILSLQMMYQRFNSNKNKTEVSFDAVKKLSLRVNSIGVNAEEIGEFKKFFNNAFMALIRMTEQTMAGHILTLNSFMAKFQKFEAPILAEAARVEAARVEAATEAAEKLAADEAAAEEAQAAADTKAAEEAQAAADSLAKYASNAAEAALQLEAEAIAEAAADAKAEAIALLKAKILSLESDLNVALENREEAKKELQFAINCNGIFDKWNDTLTSEIETLTAKNGALRAENESLSAENGALRAEIEYLKTRDTNVKAIDGSVSQLIKKFSIASSTTRTPTRIESEV